MKKIITILLALLMVLTLSACAKTETKVDDKADTTVTVSADQREGINYVTVDAPDAAKENGVIPSEAWKEAFPDLYDSYVANGDNKETVQYLETSPYLVDIYEGFGFAKDYKSARAHNYVLEDSSETLRPHALANCLTCKTADFTALVNNQGTSAYSLTFEEVHANAMENVGCYSCHENQAGNQGQLVLTHDYTAEIKDQLATDGVALDISTCGQCHTEYYFDGADNKATSIPYTGVADMNPTAELAFYDAMDFADWTQESTGTKLLKVQHPEFETYVNSVHFKMGLSCADCHMETATAADGTKYVSHAIKSPLESETILNDTCAKCHSGVDMAAKVEAIQTEITAKEDEVGAKLVALKNKLVEANKSGNYTEDELNAIRSLHRSAQWFFDYSYVENAEGAHNSSLTRDCLTKAENYITEAEALFK